MRDTLQAVVIQAFSSDTIVVIGRDLVVQRHDEDSSTAFAEGLKSGLEAAGVEVKE